MLLLLVVLFALPILVVLALYQLDWHPGGASHGELVVPPKLLQPGVQHDAQGKEFRAERLKGKWSMVYVDAAGCADACQARVRTLRQVHVSLNKEIDRVQRILLLPSAANTADIAALQQKYPDLIVLTGDDAAALAGQFDLPNQPAGTARRVYLVDPLGNLMMSYPQGHDPKGLRDDLTRLLKYSWIG